MEQHEKDYKELAAIVKKHAAVGTFTSLYYQPYPGMDCHNYSGSLFDVNYGTICATIRKDKNAPVLSRGYEVYDKNGMLIGEYNKRGSIQK